MLMRGRVLVSRIAPFVLAVAYAATFFFVFFPFHPQKAAANTISYEGSQTAIDSNNVSSITVNKPGSTTQNDVLIAVIGVDNIDSTVTPPAGWNSFTNSTTINFNVFNWVEIHVFWKAATNSEPASYTFTKDGTATRMAAGISVYRGVDILNPINIAGGNNSNPSINTSPQATSIVPTVDDTMLVTVFGTNQNNAVTYTPPSGMNERFDVGTANGVTTDVSITLADELLNSAAATGTRTGTTSASARWAALQLALRPAVPSMMIFWDGGAAPAGWTTVTQYDGKFPRGEVPGNYADTGGNGVHTPGVASFSIGANDGTPKQLNGSNLTQGAPVGHTHTANGSFTVGSASNNDEPAFRSLKLIRYNSGMPDTIPAGGIVMFDDNPGMPGAGWTRQSAQDNLMIKVNSSVATGGSDTHTHDLTWPALNAASGGPVPAISIGVAHAPHQHTHTAPAPTTTATNGTSSADCDASPGCLPPHVAPILAKANADTLVPVGMFAMFDGDPGSQWDIRSDSGDTFYRQFLRPAATFNGTSAGAASHTHVTATATTGTAAGALNVADGADIAGPHAHTLTATFNDSENMPEYFNVVIAEKNSSFVNMILFWDGTTAPTGWSFVTGFDGRFPRGEAPVNYAATGGNATHTPTTSSVTAGQATGARGNGDNNVNNNAASYTHTHTAGITGIGSANNLPVHRTLKMIRYNAGVPNIIPQGAIALFDGDPGIPNTGWTRQTDFDNRFVRNNSSSASTNGGSDTHTHNLDWAALGAASGQQRRLALLFNVNTSPVGHTHSAANDTNTSTNGTDPCDVLPVENQCLPQYVQVLLAKADVDTPTLSVGITAMFDGAPGGGWVVRSDVGGPYHQRFLRGGASYDEDDPINPNDNGAVSHTHSNATVVSPTNSGSSPGQAESFLSSGTVAEGGHTHTITAAFNAADHTPEYINVVIAEKVNFILDGYRWYEDPFPESENVTSPWSTLDIPESDPIPTLPSRYNPPDIKTELRLRVRLLVNNNGLAAGEMQFRLQYKASTDGSCTTGTWFDMGEGGGGSIWRYATSAVADGEPLDTSVIGSDILQKYVKSDSAGANPNAVAIAQTMEYDFHIEHNGALGATKYSFRLVEDTGILLSQYSECPTLSTKPATEDQLRHGNFFESGVKQGFSWAD